MISIGVITAPRDVCYLGTSLATCPWTGIHVFAEPETPSFLGKKFVTFHQNETKLGMVRNWLQALDYLCSLNTPYVMICEDDIIWLDDAKDSVESLLELNHQCMISPYLSYPNGQVAGNGWVRPYIGKQGWLGTLCTIFPVDIGYKILTERDYFIEQANGLHLDYAVGQTVAKLGVSILAHKPTLIQHLGVISTHDKSTNSDSISRKPCL